MIRTATEADMDVIVAWGADFHKASGTPIPYDAPHVRDFVASLLKTGVVFISESGMIGGVIVNPYCTTRWKMAVELFWWAKGGGRTLLREFERWAAENDADEVRMTSLGSLGRAEKLLSALGYATIEISHTKVM